MKREDIKDGWFVVGKLTKDKRAGRATRCVAQFPTLKRAETFVGQLTDPDVSRGLYTIDGPCKREAK